MELMINTLIVWLGWNVIAPLCLVLVLLVIMGLATLPTLIKQSRCKHHRYFEAGSCAAVCIDCGKNLGFIGTWREKQKLAKDTK